MGERGRIGFPLAAMERLGATRGGIRANLRAGNLVYSDIFGVMPFDNVPALVTMTGAQLTELIRLMTIPERGIPQISGLHYTFDEAGPRDNRLVAATLPNGRPLDPNASYRVALPDFLVTGGEGLGPLMATIPADQKKIDQTITLRDLLIDELKKRPMPIQPSTDGRITVLNPPPPSEER